MHCDFPRSVPIPASSPSTSVSVWLLPFETDLGAANEVAPRQRARLADTGYDVAAGRARDGVAIASVLVVIDADERHCRSARPAAP